MTFPLRDGFLAAAHRRPFNINQDSQWIAGWNCFSKRTSEEKQRIRKAMLAPSELETETEQPSNSSSPISGRSRTSGSGASAGRGL